MIKVDKNVRTPVEWRNLGKLEKQAVINHYFNVRTKRPRRPKKPFNKYKVYRDSAIKTILIDLFKGKCAYCEAKITHTQPGDVEHFRPKNRVTEESGNKITPGYYWLAADWDNLLYACDFCNRPRKHLVAGETIKKLYGKGDKFPLAPGAKRCTRYGERISREEKWRLLLHPCLDNPEEHLVFENDGNVKAAIISRHPSKKGEKTIAVCGLHRMTLVHDRADHYKRTIVREFLEIDSKRLLLKNLKGQRQTNVIKQSVRTLKNEIDNKINYLLDLAKPENEYSAFVKQMLILEFNARRIKPKRT